MLVAFIAQAEAFAEPAELSNGEMLQEHQT